MSEVFLLSPALPGPPAPTRHKDPFPWNELALTAPAPVPDSLAAITLDDKLWQVRFDGSELRRTEVDEEYVNQVSGGELHALSAPLDAETLAYLQTRRVVLYDFKWKSAKTHMIGANVEETASGGAWVTRQPAVLAVELEDTTNYARRRRVELRLRTWRIDAGGAQAVGSLELGNQLKVVKWDAGAGLVVVKRPLAALEVYDATLAKPQPEHPFAQALVKLEKDKLEVQSLRLHPSRPLALVALGREPPPVEPGKDKEKAPPREAPGVWRVTWGAEAAAPVRVASHAEGERVEIGAFHATEGWVYYAVEGSRPLHFYAQDVGGAAPGKPLALGALPEKGTRFYWLSGSPSLVVHDPTAAQLIRWRLAEGGAAKPPAPAGGGKDGGR